VGGSSQGTNHNANPKPRISIITITKQNQLAGSLWQQLHQRTSVTPDVLQCVFLGFLLVMIECQEIVVWPS
jgi:hypothetical protein